MALENRQEIAAALTAIETKTGGTLAERVEARQELRDVLAAIVKDSQGFLMHLDAIQHAYHNGLQDGAKGAPSTGDDAKAVFFAYVSQRRAELGLPPI